MELRFHASTVTELDTGVLPQQVELAAMIDLPEEVLTAFGVATAMAMVVSYALDGRHCRWIAVFAAGCAATAVYGALTGAWISVVLEAVWAAIAINRYRRTSVAFDPTVGSAAE
jgi:hypothetical protein